MSTTTTYDSWLDDVDAALKSISMSRDQWQGIWPFDFSSAFGSGLSANDAALKANRFWWKRQNEALGQECKKTPDCWLPQNHQGECEPV